MVSGRGPGIEDNKDVNLCFIGARFIGWFNNKTYAYYFYCIELKKKMSIVIEGVQIDRAT